LKDFGINKKHGDGGTENKIMTNTKGKNAIPPKKKNPLSLSGRGPPHANTVPS